MELLSYVAKSVGIFSVFYLVYYIVLRKDTFFTANRHYLLGGILAALALPFVTFTKTTYVAAPLSMPQATFIPDELPMISESLIQSEAVWTPSFWDIALWIYSLGLTIMLVRFAVQLLSLVRLLRKYPGHAKNGYIFIAVTETISPFSFFKYIVYNPKLHSENELSMILEHEQVHARQWHSIDLILAHLMRTIQWFNPLSWAYKKSIETNLEYLADHTTVQQVQSKKEYQLTLVKASSTVFAPALTNQFYQSFIKKRIIMLNKSNSNKYSQLKLSLVIPAIAVFLWSFNVKEEIAFLETPNETELNENVPAISSSEADNAVISSETTSQGAQANAFSVQNRSEAAQPNIAIKVSEATEKTATTSTSQLQSQRVVVSNPKTPINIQRVTGNTMKDIKIDITKNTTNAQFDAMKATLKKEHKLDMSYSVSRNTKNEITAISITYSGSGNSGSYNVSGDDGEPIEDFFFYARDNGETGFWSEAHEKRKVARMEESVERMEERKEEMMERKQEMIERKEEMRERMESRRSEMAERSKEMRKRSREIREEQEEREVHEAHENHNISSTISHGNGNRSHVRQSSHGNHSEHTIVIDANTSDADLAGLKADLAQQGISFSYSKIKRNSQGKITRIKIEANNGKGSQQTVFTKTDDGKPIDKVVVEL